MNIYKANWPAPANVFAFTTTRRHGKSLAPYHENNLALHVGDNTEHVLANRQALVNSFKLLQDPIWLEQTHSTTCVVIENENNRIADASVTQQVGLPLAILTADCLPILLCNQNGTEVAAIHAGWRGMVNGIIENTLAKMQSPKEHLFAWIGPAICQNCYQVGSELREAYFKSYPFALNAFRREEDKDYANLPKLAEYILLYSGVNSIYHSNACSYELNKDFYSYRQSPQTGRMATLIWFNDKIN